MDTFLLYIIQSIKSADNGGSKYEYIQKIHLAHSCARDTRQAAEEFHAAVSQKNMELVIFFCSSEYDLDVLAEEMSRLFAGIQVVGCTTAGEIGPAGYRNHSLSGVSFPTGSCRSRQRAAGALKPVRHLPEGTTLRKLVAAA